MVATIQTASTTRSKTTLWTGYILSALAILFLIFDGVIKVLQLTPAVEATTQLGYAADMVMVIGLLELVSLAVYVFPRTSVLGAILLTGYLGGAMATQMRANTGLFTLIFPVILGAFIWGGLYLRNEQLRALIPLRK